MQMQDKEEEAIVLDFLPSGYPLEGIHFPIVQALGPKHLVLLELVPRRGVMLQPKEKVYIGPGKRDKIYYIKGRLKPEKLTEAAKIQLEEIIKEIVNNNEARFVEFFNKAEAINKRMHQLELLPGFGKKHMEAIIKAREEKPFASFDEIRQRVKGLPDPKKAVEKRIMQELTEKVKHKVFTA